MLYIPDDQKSRYEKYKEIIRRQIESENSVFPKGFINKWKSSATTKNDREKWFMERFTCLYDHLVLSGSIEVKGVMEPILGMDFQENPHRLLFQQFITKQPGATVTVEDPVTHTGMQVPIPLSDLDRIYKKRMILWSRGMFKTSAVIVEIVQFILNYPNIRICFLTGGDNLAKRQLQRVKIIFEKPTKKFGSLFPEYCFKSVLNKKTNQWEDVSARMGSQHEFTVPCRTNRNFPEPTFAISTAKSVKAGSHYDLIFVDDLVNEQNYRSVKALEKCFEDYKAICPVLDPAGLMILTGTRYSYGDTYERIMDMMKEEEQKLSKTIWKVSIRDCWIRGTCIHCGHSDACHNTDINPIEPPCLLCDCPGLASDHVKGVLFPETRTFDGRSIGHTIEFLEGERLRLGPEFFANQYENCPIAQGSQTFTEALIGAQTLFHLQQIPPYLQAYTFAIADLAYIGQEGRDFSVIYICRLFQGQLFVYDCEYGNWDSGEVAQAIVNVLLKHRPAVIYPEKFNGWEAYNTVIDSLAAQRGIPKVPIMWLKGSQQDKAKLTRIGAIKGVLAAKRLWLFAGMKGYDILVEQLKKWPKLGRHDDFADCLGQVVAAPTGYQYENPPIPESTGNWLRKLNQAAPIDDSYGDHGAGTGICCGG